MGAVKVVVHRIGGFADEVVAADDFESGPKTAAERRVRVVDPRVDDRHRHASPARAVRGPDLIGFDSGDVRRDVRRKRVDGEVGVDLFDVRELADCRDLRGRCGQRDSVK